MRHHRIIEFADTYHVWYPTPKAKTDKAMSLVLSAVSGKYGFAYREVYENAFRGYDDKIALRDKLHRQYDKLKWALNLLTNDGYIDSYTCLPRGDLRINWFNGYVKMNLKILDDTFVRKLQVFHNALNNRHFKILHWWEYLPGDYSKIVLGSTNEYLWQTKSIWDFNRETGHSQTLKSFRSIQKENQKDWIKENYSINRSRKVTAIKRSLKDVF